jgi:hypothetical protein
MGKLEDLIDKRNLELEQERKAKIAEKERKEYENELALKERQRIEARAKADSINYSESVGLGILYGIIGAFIGLIGIGLALWVVLLIILRIFGNNMDSDSIGNLSGAIGLIVGGLSGYLMGFYERRKKNED